MGDGARSAAAAGVSSSAWLQAGDACASAIALFRAPHSLFLCEQSLHGANASFRHILRAIQTRGKTLAGVCRAIGQNQIAEPTKASKTKVAGTVASSCCALHTTRQSAAGAAKPPRAAQQARALWTPSMLAPTWGAAASLPYIGPSSAPLVELSR